MTSEPVTWEELQRSWQSKGRRQPKSELVAEEAAISLRHSTGAVTSFGHCEGEPDACPAA